jgi:hypothetical protein
MKRLNSWLSATTILVGAVAASAQLQLVADCESQRVFGGEARPLSLVFSNGGAAPVKVELRTRLVQASSATVVPIAERPWKQLQVLPNQTVVEVMTLDFPAVKAETRFLIQWVAGASNIVGRTEVLVYPTNLLTQLTALAGDEPLGVFDPADALKPLLRLQAVPFQDLFEDGPDKFRGKLAVFGPFETKAQMRTSLRDDIRALAKRGIAVVWLQPPPEKHAPIKPSFYFVSEGGGIVVVAAHSLVAQLATRPEAQLNLLGLAEEALHPTPMNLPETETKN